MSIVLDGTTGITTPDLTDTSLTSGRVVYAGTGGNLTGSANLVFDGNNLGVGVTPNSWSSGYKAIQFGPQGSIANDSTNEGFISYGVNFYRNASAQWTYIQTAPATKLTQYGGEFQFLAAPSGTAGTAITWTQILSASKGNTFALEGASSTTGVGIAFPATQVASSNANTLDDYEEGTWTPVVGGVTLTGAGRYTKIGRLVSISFANQSGIPALAVGTSMSCTGIPFSVVSAAWANTAIPSMGWNNQSTGFLDELACGRLDPTNAISMYNKGTEATTTLDNWGMSLVYYTT